MMHGKLDGNFVGCSRDDVFSVCDSVTKELLSHSLDKCFCSPGVREVHVHFREPGFS